MDQIPLAANQMIGAHRQFVNAVSESTLRLPELALVADAILSILAAMVSPTGFWDRRLKRTL
jgi:hypothetical protein